jgi:hypothetical protein
MADDRLGRAGTIVGIIGGVFTILFGINTFLQTARGQRTAAVLASSDRMRLGVTAALAAACIVCLLVIWKVRIQSAVTDGRMALLWSAVVIVVGVSAVAWLSTFEEPSDGAVKAVFPEADSFGGAMIRTYAANGRVQYLIDSDGNTRSPGACVRITFQLNDERESYNCGWVLFLRSGTDISDRTKLRFSIRGERGDEVIGIKAKDIGGREVSLRLSNYVGRITRDWALVEIPLSHFADVRFDRMDNFSLFVTGTMAGTRPQTIFVGGLTLQ